MSFKVQTLSTAETHEWGQRLGSLLSGGDVIALIGDLGAGKTAFAQGIGAGLGVTEVMTSPTFTLMQEYTGKRLGSSVRIIHMDLYRLRQPEEAETIGLEDNFQADSICLIEWPEIAEDLLPEDRLTVKLQGSGEEARLITLNANSARWQECFNMLGEEAFR